MFLPKTYFPTHDENRMKQEGDVEAARDYFIKNKPNNLSFLLNQRYSWMNPYLEGAKECIEIGCGAGFSKFFLENQNLRLTDVTQRPWVEETVDALNLPYRENSLDAVVASHMIHHLAKPLPFMKSIEKVLKPGGKLIIVDINTSFMMKAMLKAMRHEGWSDEINVFDENAIANQPEDPWSANCSIPKLLFSDEKKFHENVHHLKIIHNKIFEGFTFPLSGGVIAKSSTIQLPKFLLYGVEGIDRLLIALFPGIFALGRQVVLEKQVT